MSDILKKILARKAEEVAAAKQARPLARMRDEAHAAPPPRDFTGALRAKIADGQAAVIAEIKKASPSKGLLRANFDPAAIAASYAAHGAACLSVLTDREFFQGAPQYLAPARSACALPALRKDFMIDAYQVSRRAHWAPTASCSSPRRSILRACRNWRRRPTNWAWRCWSRCTTPRSCVGAHSSDPLVGINNRNLRTFETRLATTLELLPRIPPGRQVGPRAASSRART